MRTTEFSDQEYRSMLRFVAEKAKGTQKPLAVGQVWKQFKQSTKSRRTEGQLAKRFRSEIAPQIQKMQQFEMDVKVQILFAMNCSLEEQFLNESVEKKQAPVQELQTITEEQPVSTGKEQAPVPEPRAPPKEQLPPASIPEPQALQAPILQHSSIDKEAVPEIQNSPNTMRAIVLLRKLKFLALSLESSELLCFVKEINAKIDEKFDDVANRLVRIDELHETLEMALNFISLNATSSPSSEAHHTTWKNFLRCLQSVIISVNGAEFREMEERIDREIRGEMDKQIPTSKIRLALQNIIAMTIKN